jgi:hypothetical protein
MITRIAKVVGGWLLGVWIILEVVDRLHYHTVDWCSHGIVPCVIILPVALLLGAMLLFGIAFGIGISIDVLRGKPAGLGGDSGL